MVGMKDEVLQTLKNCYAASPDMVQILDADWNTVWCNRPSGADDLRERLMLPADHWESCTKSIVLGTDRCQCRLLCNRADGVRIAMFSKESNLFVMKIREIRYLIPKRRQYMIFQKAVHVSLSIFL